MNLTKRDIKGLWDNGNSAVEILRSVVRSGVEYPDAVWLVTSALHLQELEVEEMEEEYAH